MSNRTVYLIFAAVALLIATCYDAHAQQIFPCTSTSPYPQASPVQNDTTTGTTLFKMADLTSSGNAIIANHSNAAGAVGVVVAGAGTSGTACVAHIGPTPLYVDGTSTAGHCIVRSTTSDGEGHDTGSACTSNPVSGEFVGIVIVASTGADSLSVVMLKGAFSSTGSGATANQNLRTISAAWDGGGSAISASTVCAQVNFAGNITEFTMIGDVSGNATVKVQTVAYGSYTGSGSTSDISNGGETMTGAIKLQDTTLTGWTTAVTANTVFCFVLSAPATITKLVANVRVAAN